jgi:GNAT superfamily N-acetyltransferase
MNVEFRKAVIPDEIEALCAFDRVAFAEFSSDLFEPEEWAEFESYWMIVDGETVGCSAFMHDVDLDEKPRPRSLWIVSTGVLPEHQGKGLGTKQKEWQIHYAKQHGFNVIVTNMRQSNSRIIKLNDKFGFAIRELVPDYYLDPTEGAIVMELRVDP